MIILLLPGVAVSYYGEELGMTNGEIGWEETVDPWGVLAGKEKYEKYSRDPSRTPMQWNPESLAGNSKSSHILLHTSMPYYANICLLIFGSKVKV